MSEDNSKPIIKNEDSFGPIGAPVFEPRLYIQRYCYVKQELAKHNVKSVVDFGSAECKISRFLVQIPTVERIALVDLDKKLLEQHMYSVRPLTTDYLNRKDVTTDVDIYHGSVTDLDKCIVGFEAVSMVEIIEHLVSDVLSAAVTMVFGQLQPRVVVVTTPNSDFNVLFPNFSGFRHWDHKCDRVASRYGYSVDYGGVGLPPEGSEHLGMCSQAATFVRQREIFLENNGFKLTVDGSFIIIPEDDSDSDSDNDGEDEDNDSVDVRSNNTSECEEKNCVTSHEVENWD
ncbi:HENMT-like protein [Mya arenaria]|uniref:Small RNA 2'-O-methyltransferase n=1 Tax=Mya arenaria TaxID=6604 RepID=A0ABY7GF27_MYAAR|nr:HENMT-like protein [Mya arenaria]